MLQQKTTCILSNFNKTSHLAHILQKTRYTPIKLKTLPNSYDSHNMTKKPDK